MIITSTPLHPSVLLVGKPGRGRDALAELVRAQAGPILLGCADSGLLAMKAAREKQPRAVVVTSGLPDLEVVELVRQIKNNWPNVALLVLSERSEVQREALLAGADFVMPNGAPWGQLLPIVQRMVA